MCSCEMLHRCIPSSAPTVCQEPPPPRLVVWGNVIAHLLQKVITQIGSSKLHRKTPLSQLCNRPPNEISKRTTIFHPHPPAPPSSPLSNSHPNAFPADALSSSLLMSTRLRFLSLQPVKNPLIGALCRQLQQIYGHQHTPSSCME